MMIGNFHNSLSKEGEPLKTEEIGLKLKVRIRQHIRDLDKLHDISVKANAYFQAASNGRENLEITASVYASYKSVQACWLFGLALTDTSDYKAMGLSSMEEFYQVSIFLMDEEKWPGWKCTSVSKLRQRLILFNKALNGKVTFITAFESMLSKKVGNRNSLKLGLEQQAFLVNTYSPNDVGFKKLFRLYKVRAARMIELDFWKEYDSIISLSGIHHFLNKPEIKKIWLRKTANVHPKKLSISNLNVSDAKAVKLFQQ